MRVAPTLVALTLFCAESVLAQAPKETTDDPNQQQVVPKLNKITKPPAGYGTIVGQFVLDGKIPEKVLIFKKGAADCATTDQYKNDLVINEANKGIANIFFYEKAGTYKTSRKTVKRPTDYLRDAIHTSMRVPKKKTLYFDQKGCRFFPKSLLIYAAPDGVGQSVTVLSNDPVPHNTHTSSLSNTSVNFLVGANDREGKVVKMPKPEALPVGVKCDLHPWMKANWLVLDHPYMAVSNKNGRFMIEKVPAGKHEFRLWHSIPGYVHKKWAR